MHLTCNSQILNRTLLHPTQKFTFGYTTNYLQSSAPPPPTLKIQPNEKTAKTVHYHYGTF
jgi:hypothetical protein